jgi:hypothetical protein
MLGLRAERVNHYSRVACVALNKASLDDANGNGKAKKGIEKMEHRSLTHRRIEALAYDLWKERGRPIGSPAEDWFRAEMMLGVEMSASDVPGLTFDMEPVEE